ncbi:hypothetical protein SAMN05660350_00463 [Geodermatophilus obscurus]|uniref:Uncharacterized protein n=1 Tax=Geodermatophilus obscurus TaxID=1861 RepID=A0A1M7S3U7_9ACTN|nr:hypothetical protein [Geodermatophilus obscurus]SHN53130.1 hypothetical protein SAMN05660350_00463 [Geodermatophilus obscurus]
MVAGVSPDLAQLCQRANINLFWPYSKWIAQMAALIPSGEPVQWAAKWSGTWESFALLTERRVILKQGFAVPITVPYHRVQRFELKLGLFGHTLTLSYAPDGDRGSKTGEMLANAKVGGLRFTDDADRERLVRAIRLAAGLTEPGASTTTATLGMEIAAAFFGVDEQRPGTATRRTEGTPAEPAASTSRISRDAVRETLTAGRIAALRRAERIAGREGNDDAAKAARAAREKLGDVGAEELPIRDYDSLSTQDAIKDAKGLGSAHDRTVDPSSDADGNGRQPVFEVHILGPSGSGKTVFLASLFHRLRIRRPELAFYLKSDFDSSSYLNAVYNQVTDLEGGWPPSSQGVHEWNFTTVVQSAVNDFEPLAFRYLDYPGGVLTNPRAAQDESVQALVWRLRAASALLVLLDGQAMVALLEGDPRGARYMSFELTSSLEIAQQSRCPLHFAITKWDLLHGRYTLEQLRDRLLAEDNFADLIAAKAQDTPATIRLLPVSAVGYGFADSDATGGMHKTGQALRPVNVELPLLSVLPDFLQYAHTEITQRAAALTALSGQGPNGAGQAAPQSASPMARRLSAGALRATLAAQHPLLGLIPASVFEEAVGYGERLLKNRTARSSAGPTQHAADLMAARRDLHNDQQALRLLQDQCEHLITQFEEAHPASNLTQSALHHN